ncbi:hypothetical protein A2467_01825 [Candidatus Nomurabacteria bacterium RIFOXYC2_FULL_36_8]|nr:MAG: hypothetical protein UR97_C0005G0029 [Candidatus Nomurabacteria bacterium GW2011_GWE2_36_115]KKP93744.1 MAG: hypothetical protein US00_C0005G0029 [Candidatus Nomurabacteria bacterium GW2011_GWF2_36_126]KKP97187.1 MAG: hypothetical protein US04_C0001G0690 [Candidatus Nomurabacteria bacterium GW2011_GWD2_36_14]KKP99206.1 MAG: hypothetical protein US08_C0002G0029 [Candidatus Nomurabacteria bacterium GW2011_GWF2_36_19]KKQ05853.1 MAG: hypothetical protein US17_C0001G0031 [Candidatus Nomuraba
MKTKERKILIGGFVLLIIVLVFLFLNRKKEIPIIVPLEQNYTEEKIETIVSIKNQKNKGLKTVQTENSIKIKFSVLDKKYEVETREGASVFEMMKTLEEKSTPPDTFSFKYKEVSGLGSFITEINGVKGAPGEYWMYYVNDKLASIGVSQYILKEGDIISWKNEGI